MTLLDLTKQLLDESSLWRDPDLPFSATLEVGHPRVLIVAGENCSGKSLLAQSLTSWAKHHHGITNISVSIRERTGAGTFELAGMRRIMMFGDDSEQSTGAGSARVIDSAFQNLKSRADETHRAILMLDEPELGLSEGYAGAMGRYIGSKALIMPDLSSGVAIVTHSRVLGRELAASLNEAPSFLMLNGSIGLAEWLKGDPVRTVEELLGLPKLNHERWKLVNKVLERKRKTSSL